MTHDEAIRRVERLRDGFKRQISEGSADGYWDHLQKHVDTLEAVLILLRGSGVSSMMKDDQGAALLPGDPISEVTSEALPNTGIPRIPNVWENAAIAAGRLPSAPVPDDAPKSRCCGASIEDAGECSDGCCDRYRCTKCKRTWLCEVPQ